MGNRALTSRWGVPILCTLTIGLFSACTTGDDASRPQAIPDDLGRDAVSAFLILKSHAVGFESDGALLQAGIEHATEFAAPRDPYLPPGDATSPEEVIIRDLKVLASRSRRAPREIELSYIEGLLSSLGLSHAGFFPEGHIYVDEHMYGFSSVPESSGRRVWEVRKDSQASYAGLRPGDLIVSINGMLPHFESVPDLNGDQSLRVDVSRDSKIMPLVLRSMVLGPPALSTSRLDPTITYIRSTTFTHPRESYGLIVASAMRFAASTGNILLDLRGNHGGDLANAISLVSALGYRGHVATSKGRAAAHDSSVSIDEPLAFKTPDRLLILIDSQTASAAEIIALCLASMPNVILVGSPTAGMVVGGRTYPLSSGQLQVPVARVLSGPDFVDLEKVGVRPDYRVELQIGLLQMGRDHVLETAIQLIPP